MIIHRYPWAEAEADTGGQNMTTDPPADGGEVTTTPPPASGDPPAPSADAAAAAESSSAAPPPASDEAEAGGSVPNDEATAAHAADLQKSLDAATAELAAMREEFETYKGRVSEEKAAEYEAKFAEMEAKQAKDAEVLAKQRQALREGALAAAKVKTKFYDIAPEFDPTTTEGRAALATWAQANPELLSDTPGDSPEQPTEQRKREKADTVYQRLVKKFGKKLADQHMAARSRAEA